MSIGLPGPLLSLRQRGDSIPVCRLFPYPRAGCIHSLAGFSSAICSCDPMSAGVVAGGSGWGERSNWPGYPPPPKRPSIFARFSFRLSPRLVLRLFLLTGIFVFPKLRVGLRRFYSPLRLRRLRGMLAAAGLLALAVHRGLRLRFKFCLSFELDDPDLARAGVQHLLYRLRLLPGHRVSRAGRFRPIGAAQKCTTRGHWPA